MAFHPINLGLRFLLEIAALIAAGLWGWQNEDGWLKFLFAFGIPFLIAILWGTFRVPKDPGKAPVAIPGLLRLIFEIAVFAFAVWALADAHFLTLSRIMGAAVIIHYLTSYDRILWIIKQ